jgi:type IV pilus assembly protein PilE
VNRKDYRIIGQEHHNKGFTLIELMIVVVVVAILASIALPSYRDYITKSRARAAGADLMAASTALENIYQRTLSYPTVATTGTTAATQTALTTWAPAMGDFFTYTLTSTSASYDLASTGTGVMSGCNLTLDESNNRGITSACIETSW